MRILFLSKQGDGLGIADRLTQEGHDVRFWASDSSYARDLQGIVARVDTWRPSVTWADLVVADMVGFSAHEPVFQRYGKPVISCNPVADILELDRSKAMTAAQAVGMTVPKHWSFRTPAQALLDFEWKEPVYIKPSGNLQAGETRCAQTYEQFRWTMGHLPVDQDVVVQERIEGIEISTEGWFNGTDFIRPFNHTFEEKFLLPGCGPNTGSMGSLVVRAGENRLVSDTLLRMVPFLRKAAYRGPLDINCIVSKDAAYFLEFTARMGYDAIEALATGLREPLGALLFETAAGTKKEMSLTKDYMIAVRLCSPPYPFAGAATPNVPLDGIVAENRKYFFPTGVMKRGDRYLTSGSDGVVGKVTAAGRTVQEARSRVYRTLGNIKGVDLFYRQDIGTRVERDLAQLKEWGWL